MAAWDKSSSYSRGRDEGPSCLSPVWWACDENSTRGRMEAAEKPEANSSAVTRKRGSGNPYCHLSSSHPLSRGPQGGPHCCSHLVVEDTEAQREEGNDMCRFRAKVPACISAVSTCVST